MILFPKLPRLRGKRAAYEVNGTVSAKVMNPHWRHGDVGPQFVGARLHSRDANPDVVELATLNFVKLHAAAAHGTISLKRFDNNGYSFHVKTWDKTAQGWN